EFTRAASMAGAALPALQPTAAEIAAIMPALGDLSDAASGQFLRTASATLDAADVALGTRAPASVATAPLAVLPTGGRDSAPTQRTGAPASPDEPAPVKAPRGIETWRAGPRNSLVYGACTVVVLVLQAVLFYSVTNPALASPLCIFVFPAFAWAVGWVL